MKITHIATLAAAALLSFGAAAATVNQPAQGAGGQLPAVAQSMIPRGMEIQKVSDNQWTFQPKQRSRKAAEATDSVTLIAQIPDSLKSVYRGSNAMIFDTDSTFFANGWYPMIGQPTTFVVPKGTYEVGYRFQGSQMEQYLVIHEQVKIDGDTTIYFNPLEATKHLKFRAKNLKGEFWTLNTYDSNWQIQDDGNCQAVFLSSSVKLKGFTQAYAIGGGFNSIGVQINSDYNLMGDFFVKP